MRDNFTITAQEIIDTAMRSGAVKVWYVDVVREKDKFSCKYDSAAGDPVILHEPDAFASEDERGEIIGAYSVVELASGRRHTETMSRAEIDKAKAKSKATGKDSPWELWFGEMCKKCIQKRHAKRFSKSSELRAIIDKDNEREGAAEPIRHDTGNGAPEGYRQSRGEYDKDKDERPITEPQWWRLVKIAQETHGGKLAADRVIAAVLEQAGLARGSDIQRNNYDEIVEAIEQWEPGAADAVEGEEWASGGADDIPF